MRGTYGLFLTVSAIAFIAAGVFAVTDLLPRHANASVPSAAAPAAAASAAAPAAASTAPLPAAPVAAKKDHAVTTPFGVSRNDPYYWLNEKTNPEVATYLEAENAYANAALAPLEATQAAIFKELEDRASLPDQEVPYADSGFYYQQRFDAGADYPVIVRMANSPTGPEEVVLNVPELAKGHEQYFLRGWKVSPDGTKVAFAVDFKGDRINEIFVRDIATNAVTSTGIKDASSDIAWTADGKAFFYTKLDETVRGFQVKRHIMGADPATDTVMIEEPDTTFELSIAEASSKEMAIITVYHLQRTELWAVSLTSPDPKPVLLLPRTKNVRANADHFDGKFYILTNDGAPDLKVIALDDTAPDLATAETVVAEVPGHYIENIALFDKDIAVQEVHDATSTVKIVDRATGAVKSTLDFGPLGVTTLEQNKDATLPFVRVTFESATLPPVTYQVDLATGAKTELKKSPAYTWFKPELYEATRIMAPAKDGKQVPVTLVWRKDLKKVGGNPTLVYGYGAYGITTEPGWYRNYVSLLDRGFVVAVAHIRGSRDLGDAWYQGGRMQTKMNTFTDFIAATEGVIAQGYADPKHVYAQGGSAGGLLMGAVNNLRPDLYDGIVAQVPFVDVLTTMLDDTIPLTTFEYEEWGNPNIQEQYNWMAAYSPYDNVAAKAYPPLFVLTGFNDSQVGYFEPAKWVAKLRATKTDKNQLLFLCNMGAGHSGNSGRTGPLADRAKVFAWLADRAGK
ncbi:Dipeptidyl aminopeptidase BI [Alphaproteobacteria bacterium SO-S41]|nr:Dipeptidyl aminopeptidase BI [Alphaproteobacteria bacterium SO-S41]